MFALCFFVLWTHKLLPSLLNAEICVIVVIVVIFIVGLLASWFQRSESRWVQKREGVVRSKGSGKEDATALCHRHP